MSAVSVYYSKVFGIGFATGCAMEIFLIKSNYYQMLAASEAKQRLKDLKQEQEDAERLRRMQEKTTATNSSTN